jgi:hypothetical protein
VWESLSRFLPAAVTDDRSVPTATLTPAAHASTRLTSMAGAATVGLLFLTGKGTIAPGL